MPVRTSSTIICAQCGYDLKGLRAQQPCPECASTLRAIPKVTAWYFRPLYWFIAVAIYVILGMAGYAFLHRSVGEYLLTAVGALLSPPVLILAIIAALATAISTRKRSPFQRVDLEATISVFIAAAMVCAVIFSIIFQALWNSIRIA